MALDTQGWDYIYSIKLDKVNELLKAKAIEDNGFIASSIKLGTTELKDIKVTDFVIESTTSPVLKVNLTLTCTLGTKPLADVSIKIDIDMDWLNTNDDPTKWEDIKLREAPTTITPLGPLEAPKFNEIIRRYISKHDPVSANNISAPSPFTYKRYYEFFSILNKFPEKNGWMKTNKQSFSIKKVDNNCVFSVSCMIDGENKGGGYVDMNAIPEGATSALVINKKTFGEQILIPSFDNNKLYPKGQKITGSKTGDIYTNDGDISLLSKDYRNYEDITVSGTVKAKNMAIKIQDSEIELFFTEVEYKYKPEYIIKIDQRYDFILGWDTANKKVKPYGTAKLFSISSSEIGPEWWVNWVNLLAPLAKNIFLNSWLEGLRSKDDDVVYNFMNVPSKGNTDDGGVSAKDFAKTKTKKGQVVPLDLGNPNYHADNSFENSFSKLNPEQKDEELKKTPRYIKETKLKKKGINQTKQVPTNEAESELQEITYIKCFYKKTKELSLRGVDVKLIISWSNKDKGKNKLIEKYVSYKNYLAVILDVMETHCFKKNSLPVEPLDRARVLIPDYNREIKAKGVKYTEDFASGDMKKGTDNIFLFVKDNPILTEIGGENGINNWAKLLREDINNKIDAKTYPKIKVVPFAEIIDFFNDHIRDANALKEKEEDKKPLIVKSWVDYGNLNI